jgi:CheY-like chemotaxis protein
MPAMDGFEVIKTIGAERNATGDLRNRPTISMLESFEVNALDYLLKPFDRSRFKRHWNEPRR